MTETVLRVVKSYDPTWPGPFCTQEGRLVVDVTRSEDGPDNPYPITGFFGSSRARYTWTAEGLSHATRSTARDPMNLMCGECPPDTQETPIAAATPEAERGLRYNADKLRYDLVPPDAMEALVRVFTFGAKKYAPRNWEKGMPWMECDASLRRHLAAWEMGEHLDPESGEPHLAHAVWNALALLTFELRDIGEDDRPSIAPSNPRS